LGEFLDAHAPDDLLCSITLQVLEDDPAQLIDRSFV
jgi:hypothetical protein